MYDLDTTTTENTHSEIRLERQYREGMRPLIAAATLMQLAYDRLLDAAQDIEETAGARRVAQEVGGELRGLTARLYWVAEAD